MTVYDIPNIEHCDVSAFGASHYRIVAHPGWYIHLPTNEPGFDEDGNPTKVYKGIALLSVNYDFSTVEITAEADLPDNAEICGGDNPEHKIV